MKIDLLKIRQNLGKTQLDMARTFGICRGKYIKSEQKGEIEDRYVYRCILNDQELIVNQQLPEDFFDYTTYTLLLNLLIYNTVCGMTGKGMTQDELAKKLGYTQPYISLMLKKFFCLYDMKEKLVELFIPYFIPMVATQEPRIFKKFVNVEYPYEMDLVICQRRGDSLSNSPYAGIAIAYNMQIYDIKPMELAKQLDMEEEEMLCLLRENADMSGYEAVIKDVFPQFLIPFYNDGSGYVMVGTSDNLQNIMYRSLDANSEY